MNPSLLYEVSYELCISSPHHVTWDIYSNLIQTLSKNIVMVMKLDTYHIYWCESSFIDDTNTYFIIYYHQDIKFKCFCVYTRKNVWNGERWGIIERTTKREYLFAYDSHVDFVWIGRRIWWRSGYNEPVKLYFLSFWRNIL